VSFKEDGIIYCVTSNYFDKLDKAFVMDGRFDSKILMSPCVHYQIQQIFKDFLKKIIENEIPLVSIIMRFVEFLVDMEALDNEIMLPFVKS
jgi:ATP-dependent 26S proteasome regulatory subunit